MLQMFTNTPKFAGSSGFYKRSTVGKTLKNCMRAGNKLCRPPSPAASCFMRPLKNDVYADDKKKITEHQAKHLWPECIALECQS